MQKIKQQTVYMPVDVENPNRIGWIEFFDAPRTEIIEKKEQQVVMSVEEFEKQMEDVIDAYLTDRVNIGGIANYQEWKDTYIKNLLEP